MPKMAGAKSRSYRVVVNPIGGGSASPSEVIKCDVPTGRGRYTLNTGLVRVFIPTLKSLLLKSIESRLTATAKVPIVSAPVVAAIWFQLVKVQRLF